MVALLLVGLWIALAPFARPLPGGEAFSFEATPEVGCQSPVIGMFGADQPVADVYTVPRPSEGDPVESRSVDCTGRARFRVAVGGLLVAMAAGRARSRRR